MSTTSRTRAMVQVQPESESMPMAPRMVWKVLSTHETTHLKGSRIVSRNPIVLFILFGGLVIRWNYRVVQFNNERLFALRSEERRVGKECRSRWWTDG